MIVNILDYRSDRFNFSRIDATIIPFVYENNMRPDGTFFKRTNEMPLFDTLSDVNIIEAIEWANNQGFDLELGLNDPIF